MGLPLLVFSAGCGPSQWTPDEQGIQHFTTEGSWRALIALSDEEAWAAESGGDWMRIQFGHGAGRVRRFEDTVLLAADSSGAPHYRGMVVTDDAIMATVIASPGMIRKAVMDADGMPSLPRKTVWESAHPRVFLDAILSLDSRHLVAMGDPIDSCLCVLTSSDGGDSWTKIPCASDTRAGVPPSLEGEAAFAASNGNLSAQGDTVWMLSGGGASRVYRSLDRGRSWNAYPTPLQQGGQMTGGFSMDFCDARHGIIWGGNWEAKDDRDGRAAVTEDGGETWAVVAKDHGMGYGSSVRYQPGSGGLNLVVVGTPGGIDLSEDGGRNWRHFSDSAFYAARFSPDGAALWLSGNGRVARVSARNLGW